MQSTVSSDSRDQRLIAWNNCGSEPARDDGRTFNIAAECRTAIASRHAPTGDVLEKVSQALGKLGASTASRLRWNRKYAP